MPKFQAQYVPYEKTNAYSKLVLDYLEKSEKLKPFITDFPSVNSIEKFVKQKAKQPINRKALVEVLKEQYSNHNIESEQIEMLLDENTFTICTAHQPNIFTGFLYTIYKIVHAINLAKECEKEISGKQFVPVFFIGSEDNDIEEIGTIFHKEKKYQWQPKQQGACGRFSTESLVEIRDEIVSSFGTSEAETKLKEQIENAYNGTNTLAEATRVFLHALFGEHGLVILDADDALLKECFAPIIEEELKSNISHKIVTEQIEKLSAHYKVQVEPREINLFYMAEGARDRIVSVESGELKMEDYSVAQADLKPKHYSPNVILRPLYQEMILPNVAFIGGGSEVAYWMELKSLFDYFKVPFPIIYLRNSVAFLEKRASDKLSHFQAYEYFQPIDDVLKDIVKEEVIYTKLEADLDGIEKQYENAVSNAKNVSESLHVSAQAQLAKIKHKNERILTKYRAHLKRKEIDTANRLLTIRDGLFPNDKLQERHENYLTLVQRFKVNIIPILLAQQEVSKEEFLILKEE